MSKAAKTNTPAGNTPAASAAVNPLFSDVDETKLVRRNMPTLVNHKDVPLGKSVSGEIIAIVDSPVTTIKGKLLHVRHANGTEFSFPCTGSIRTALAPGKDGAELDAALKKLIGKQFAAKRLADKKGAESEKVSFVFDVFTN